MSSVTDIYNLALSMIGDAGVQSPSESTAQARQCNIHYPTARDTLLRAFPWEFAKEVEELAIVGTAPKDWQYQYAYPSNSVRLLEIVRSNKDDLPVPYEIGRDAAQNMRVIWTDEADASVRVIRRVTDTSVYPQTFVQVLAANLASRIAMALTREPKIQAAMQELFRQQFSEAAAISAEEQTDTPPADAPWHTER